MVDPRDQKTTEVFLQLMRKHQRLVFAVAYARLKNSHDAEDVMQEVFIEMYRNMKKLRNSKHAAAWLFRATQYRCKDHIRKTLRREKREATYAESSTKFDISTEDSHDANMQERIVEAIGTLPEKFRVLIMLKHFVNLSYAEISEMTGLSGTTIDGRLRAAKKKLKEQLIDMVAGVNLNE